MARTKQRARRSGRVVTADGALVKKKKNQQYKDSVAVTMKYVKSEQAKAKTEEANKMFEEVQDVLTSSAPQTEESTEPPPKVDKAPEKAPADIEEAVSDIAKL